MPYMLPRKHHFNHQYCFFLHDLMVEIIKIGEQNMHFGVKFDLKPNETPFVSKLTGEELLQWMIENNYKEKVDLLMYKQVFVATLSDFLQFIFHSLRSSEKGQLAVAYSLLRKPLKDDLFILESLLSEPNDFIRKYNSEDSFDQIAIEKQTPEQKLRTIKDVLTKIPFPLINEDFVYKVRYSKSEVAGLEQLWQKATHIVTSSKHFRTEKGNLNFVFSTEEDKREQWGYLYLILPFLLFYSYQVCSSIYYGIIAEKIRPSESLMNRILIGHIISNRLSVKDSSFTFDEDLTQLYLKCGICNEDINYTEKIDEQIIHTWKYTCGKAHENYFFELQ